MQVKNFVFVAACTDSGVPRRQARAKETWRRDDQEARVGCAQGVGKHLALCFIHHTLSIVNLATMLYIVILSTVALSIMASNL